jgi:N-acetylglucosamine kinase-like BadF-type ATPase
LSQTTTSPLYLGVDGGASNITMAVVDERGKVMAQQLATGGANYHALGLEEVLDHLESVLQEMLEQFSSARPAVFRRAVFGLAGCNFPSDKNVLTQALRQSRISTVVGGSLEVVNDSRVALRSGTKDGVGIALIAGTGSNCYGRAADGREGQAGGLDHILSDEGSGYDIGLRGLRAVVAQLDGRGETTKITKQVFAKLGVDSLEALHSIVYESYTSKSQIASLATIVAECAGQGDVVARDILNHSVNELVSLVDAVLKQLEWQETSMPVVLVGSVLRQSYVASRLKSEIRRIAPMLKLVTPDVPAAVGAAWMAMEGARST